MKMIIDSHAHIGRILTLNLSVKNMLYSMERYGVDFSLVSSIKSTEYFKPGKRLPWPLRSTQYRACLNTVRAARQYPDKIGAVLWLQIDRSLPDERLERLIEQNRNVIYGIKIHPFRSETAPDDPKVEPVYELARRFSLPVSAHTGSSELAMTRRLYNAAEAHPDINFIAVHMDLESGNKEAADLISRLPNLYGDTTWVPVKSTLYAIEKCGSRKILFGTDNTIDGRDHMLYNRDGQRSLCQEYFNEFRDMVSPEVYADVMYRNAQRLFGIKMNEGFLLQSTEEL